MTDDQFEAIVAALRTEMRATGQDENVLSVAAKEQTLRLPLPKRETYAVSLRGVQIDEPMFDARKLAREILATYRASMKAAQ
jgi:hypothetical protein